jgi:hypothetical protein
LENPAIVPGFSFCERGGALRNLKVQERNVTQQDVANRCVDRIAEPRPCRLHNARIQHVYDRLWAVFTGRDELNRISF